MRNVFFLLALLGLAAADTYGLVLDNPSAYVMETYAQYTKPGGIGGAYSEFDGAGNLYITHGNGSLVKITPDGQSQVVDQFLNIQGIVYAGGTTYGDVLYFNDAYAHATLARQADGTTSSFSTMGGTPIGITIDRMGLFDGKMFVSRRYGSGDIYRIHETGQYELFTQIGLGMSAHDIEADPSGLYGGLLYLCVSDESTDTFTPWSVHPDGTVNQFSSLTHVKDLAFDTTENSAFGGLLYARRSSWAIGSISSSGEWSRLGRSNDTSIGALTFGPDNSMYVLEEIPGNPIISVIKISAVPEPASLLLLGLGGLLIRKR